MVVHQCYFAGRDTHFANRHSTFFRARQRTTRLAQGLNSIKKVTSGLTWSWKRESELDDGATYGQHVALLV